MLFARTASAAELGLLGTGAAKLPVRVVGVASVPLRGVTFAFAAVSCVVITYEPTWACRMDMLTYSADISLMYMGWACEILVVPAHRQSRAAVAGGTDLWSVVWGSVRLQEVITSDRQMSPRIYGRAGMERRSRSGLACSECYHV